VPAVLLSGCLDVAGGAGYLSRLLAAHRALVSTQEAADAFNASSAAVLVVRLGVALGMQEAAHPFAAGGCMQCCCLGCHQEVIAGR
jgi:hypothetical protein